MRALALAILAIGAASLCCSGCMPEQQQTRDQNARGAYLYAKDRYDPPRLWDDDDWRHEEFGSTAYGDW